MFLTAFVIVIGVSVAIEWAQRDKQHALEIGRSQIPRLARWIGYYALILSIILYGGGQQDFIYFQF